MSDHWIGIIPKNPNFVPSEAAIAQAEEYMAELAPGADNIATEIGDMIQFRDCGSNFESVRCPLCDIDLTESDWWTDQMDDAYQENSGFRLKPTSLPCGHEVTSLNDLKYEFEQGFSRFILDMMNPNIGPLDAEQIARLEAIFGCRIKVIYKHF